MRKNEENCLVYLCGCKKDLVQENKQVRKVDFHDVNDYADDIKAKLFETSSLKNDGVADVFQTIVDDYYEDETKLSTKNGGNDPLNSSSVSLRLTGKRSFCCFNR